MKIKRRQSIVNLAGKWIDAGTILSWQDFFASPNGRNSIVILFMNHAGEDLQIDFDPPNSDQIWQVPHGGAIRDAIVLEFGWNGLDAPIDWDIQSLTGSSSGEVSASAIRTV